MLLIFTSPKISMTTLITISILTMRHDLGVNKPAVSCVKGRKNEALKRPPCGHVRSGAGMYARAYDKEGEGTAFLVSSCEGFMQCVVLRINFCQSIRYRLDIVGDAWQYIQNNHT